jgi:hypothetical protein
MTPVAVSYAYWFRAMALPFVLTTATCPLTYIA